MPPTIKDLKPYVPAKDFELSQRFYAALGFTLTPAFGGTYDAELNGHRFRLQDAYVKDWANNFMMLIVIDAVEAWHEHVLEMQSSGNYPGMRVQDPVPIGGSQVLHVHDPSGVLLVFVQ
mgnify:CR=1 FL=1